MPPKLQDRIRQGGSVKAKQLVGAGAWERTTRAPAHPPYPDGTSLTSSIFSSRGRAFPKMELAWLVSAKAFSGLLTVRGAKFNLGLPESRSKMEIVR